MKKIFYTGLLSVLIFSCSQSSNKSSSSVAEIEKQIYAVHDEIMPHMTTIIEFAEKADSLASIDSATYLPLAKALHQADSNMMQWMRNYKFPTDATEDVQLNFLNEQKMLVDQLKVQINDVLNKANATIK